MYLHTYALYTNLRQQSTNIKSDLTETCKWEHTWSCQFVRQASKRLQKLEVTMKKVSCAHIKWTVAKHVNLTKLTCFHVIKWKLSKISEYSAPMRAQHNCLHRWSGFAVFLNERIFSWNLIWLKIVSCCLCK